MGWSCRAEVSETMEAMTAAEMFNCVAVDDGEYFIELSNREYADGRASCTVMRFTSGKKGDDTRTAMKVSTFTIRPDGSTPKAPTWVKLMIDDGRKALREGRGG